MFAPPTPPPPGTPDPAKIATRRLTGFTRARYTFVQYGRYLSETGRTHFPADFARNAGPPPVLHSLRITSQDIGSQIRFVQLRWYSVIPPPGTPKNRVYREDSL
jgi:hypothetical protein